MYTLAWLVQATKEPQARSRNDKTTRRRVEPDRSGLMMKALM